MLMLAKVAPYAGAWIEICKKSNYYWSALVAPYAGAWIEIFLNSILGGIVGRPLCRGVD